MFEIETITPDDDTHWRALREKDITSTQVGALFNESPYATEYELFHQLKSGVKPTIAETERMEWGLALESAIANKIAEKHGWKIRRAKEYVRVPSLSLGASFDYFIEEPFDAILEIKNVDSLAFRDNWIVEEDGNVQAPLHIEFQAQTQMLVTGKSKLYIGALVGGNELYLLERQPDPATHDAIRLKTAQMWRRIANNDPPAPDFSRDMAVIRQVYGYSEPGRCIEATAEIESLALRYLELAAQKKEIEELQNEAKAGLLMSIGDAEKVLGSGYTISAKQVKSTWVEAYERKSYRDFRINRKKGKTE